MAPQHIIYNLRNHFENIVDNHYLDPGRAPIVRENIDMLALAGRECTVYGGSDVIPLCMLWTIDVCSRGIAFTVPIRRCSWFMSTSGLPLVWRMAILAVTSAMVIILLNEMWSLWDPFGRGVNTFSWTLGIASEIDNMINEFYESENKVPVREHKFMDSGEYLSSSNSSSSGATRTTTTGTGTAPSEDTDAQQRRRW
ncbi:hypothetical protein ISF_02899 [Cordyceps fumosorosea ARSEF 2679]|uniref:Uncharacterized protein n=1 Tax=Cordyceps fumosorosea (strain ARSEF 2679) TaxID=1081104 RepID=A0A162MSJ4_CORFA|nr:hypothetical protein ISF_02899 [Cordyceps fumosorosea ARSEF 2679]OAA69629.1 hypothetical protein ISF_02899 [Cordyceps fumosorosea ARSEF 2679]